MIDLIANTTLVDGVEVVRLKDDGEGKEGSDEAAHDGEDMRGESV